MINIYSYFKYKICWWVEGFIRVGGWEGEREEGGGKWDGLGWEEGRWRGEGEEK